MPKTKKSNRKPSVKVQDLEAGKDPKGGACTTGKHLSTGTTTTRITDGTSNT
jgi:hypothetical protein